MVVHVQSERDINTVKLLSSLKYSIDMYNKKDNKGYLAETNIQTLLDCYDVLKKLDEGDDCK